MKKLLLETSFSKIYMIVMIIITLLILGSYFSYAMFTVTKEKSNAISIVTGNLTYKLEVDGKESNTLSVPSNSSKEFILTLSNPNNRIARFNFYYMGRLPSNVYMGYLEKEGYNITPEAKGVNLEKNGTSGSSNTYIIRITNNSNSDITITLGVGVGLDYNDLELQDNSYLFDKYAVELSNILLSDVDNNINTTDSEQTFITGEEPDNYIWYSGKLWRAVSIDPSDNSVKLVTQWNISTMSYNTDSTFKGSYMEKWLNDTSVDGFLGNLREPEKFIKMDSIWNATMTTSTDKPAKTTLVTAPVGLLNVYEIVMSYTNTTYNRGYIQNSLDTWLITPYNDNEVWTFSVDFSTNPSGGSNTTYVHSVRPSVNLKSGLKTVDGTGTEEDPYRLEGDNDTNLNGTLLNTRYSGEYIEFGTGENNLYRIVSHEKEGLTKIVSAEPLKDSGIFKSTTFGNSALYSKNNTIGTFLNGNYLNSYLTSDQVDMIEDDTTWYLGTVGDGRNYIYSKYTNTDMTTLTTNIITAKVGLLRYGELMAGQFNLASNQENIATGLTTYYWTLTPASNQSVWSMSTSGSALVLNPSSISRNVGIRPSLNLKQSVVIVSGTGQKNNPFTIDLAS